MKKIIILPVFIVILFSIYFFFYKNNSIPGVSESKYYQKFDKVFKESETEGSVSGENMETERNESEAEKNQYADYPSYNKQFTFSEFSKIWNYIDELPSEYSSSVINQWNCIGPYGSQTYWSGGPKYSGRIVDISTENAMIRVAAASGGIWGFQSIVPVPLSDSLQNQIIGAFAVKPGDPNTIITGTGEPQNGGGTGLYKTTDGGASWQRDVTAFNNSPGQFFRIKYLSNSKVHAVCDKGYFRSDNDGNSWIQKYPSSGTLQVTDIVIAPQNTNLLYIAVTGDGLYRSTDGGNNFSKVTNFPVGSSMLGRTSLALCSGNSNFLYAIVANSQNLQGIYRTTDNCVSWQNITPANWFSGTAPQMNYNNTIAVNPSDPSVVMAGGVHLFITTNGGTAWTDYAAPPYPVHDDIHFITWYNANTVYVGCDGGLFFSANNGNTWSSALNTFPITQFYNGACGVNNTNVIIGGTQDNGVNISVNGGNTWRFVVNGDADGSTVDPGNANNMFATTFDGGGNYKNKSTDMGLTWFPMNSGFNTSMPGTSFRNDLVAPVFIYSENGNSVKYSEPPYSEWNIFNGGNFSSAIGNGELRVSKYSTGGAVVYAPLLTTVNPEKLKVNDNGIWYSRADNSWGSDLVLHVSQHPVNNNRAYAIIAGSIPSRKIYKTFNRGVNWINITGDFPSVPVTDVLPHPTDTNIIYAATKQFGCFKTTNSGVNWIRWNNGMQKASWVSEMFYIDSMAARGKFYILAATYGRSMYIREISGEDPLTGIITNINQPGEFNLYQNFPNPFNPSTKINFALPNPGNIELKIFDMTGKLLVTLYNGYKPAGKYSMDFDGSKFASGVYFYTLKTENFSDTKKMILLK